jgi:hypothetical protein
VSPILVRPVREQLEHDRIIRLLQPKYKRRYAAVVNPGTEQNQGIGEGAEAIYPDVVLLPLGRGRKIAGIIEVETQESVNNLEAIAQWAVYGRQPTEFALYVPAVSVDVARRLCQDNRIGVTEIWTYHTVGDVVRFTLVHKSPVEAKLSAARAAAAAAAAQQREAERAEKAARRAAARKAAQRKAGRATSSRKAAAGRSGSAAKKAPARKASASKSKRSR